jgi:hypothetical protein
MYFRRVSLIFLYEKIWIFVKNNVVIIFYCKNGSSQTCQFFGENISQTAKSGSVPYVPDLVQFYLHMSEHQKKKLDVATWGL